MRRVKVAALLGAVMMLASSGLVSAQVAYDTPFATSITYQNVSANEADVQFAFRNEKSSTVINVNRKVPANAGSSLFVGGLQGSEKLPDGFQGSAVLSANQPIVATLVQIPQPGSSPVKNRPLSNGFNSASSSVLLATVLKNKFNTTSVFSVQNAETNSPIDITVRLFDADNPQNPAIVVTETSIPVGAAKYFDMGKLGQVTANVFNGSATVTAVQSGGPTPANIVASVMELSTNSVAAKAFEGVTSGGTKIFMATALCDMFAQKQRTAYAVQNNGQAAANITVKYSNGINQTAAIDPGKKASMVACDAPGMTPGFSGAATIESVGADIVVIGKAFSQPATPGFETAFLGEKAGVAKMALPYVRWTNDAAYNAGGPQRTFIAIQNVGTAAATNVAVKYLDNVGNVLGTHTIASIAASAKANSTPVDATPTTPADAAKLLEFGTGKANANGAFGGSVIIEATGGQLIAIGRVASKTADGIQVAEDFNGIPVQ